MSDFQNVATPFLNAEHIEEWVEGSGVSFEITRINLRSIDVDEMNSRVKPAVPIKTGGWWVSGRSWQSGIPKKETEGQGKPDKPHDLGKGKKAKYMSPSGSEVDAIFLEPGQFQYWNNIFRDKTRKIFLTEGVKKAAAGLTIGLPTIALTGVWNWGKNGELCKSLSEWAESGREVYILFDSDYRDKEQCVAAIVNLGKALRAKGCKVKVVTWHEDYKGMDDFIVAKGKDAFLERVNNAQTVSTWERKVKESKRLKSKTDASDSIQENAQIDDNLRKSKGKKKKQKEFPKQRELRGYLSDKLNNRLAWRIDQKEWYWYGEHGIWEYIDEVLVRKIIIDNIDEFFVGTDGDYGNSYIISLMNLVKTQVAIRDWNQTDGLIALKNGVLDKETLELHPHSASYYLTNCLPFDYDPSATCPKIEKWLLETVGGREDVYEFLLAYLNAVVYQRSHLQIYLEMIGYGGAGKSTFINLATGLVGDKNSHVTSHDLLKNQFEAANIKDKMLTVITEADQYVGNVNLFKSIVGGDALHYEKKGIQAGKNFKYTGMVITSGNEPSQTTDHTSGLRRRKRPVYFHNIVPKNKRVNLDEEFKFELPGLLNLVLSLEVNRVEKLLVMAEELCPNMAAYRLTNLIETNPIADWVNECVIYAPGVQTSRNELYGSYSKFCQAEGNKPMNMRRFKTITDDLWRSQLGWDVTHGRNSSTRFSCGVRVRRKIDTYDLHPTSITRVVDFEFEPGRFSLESEDDTQNDTAMTQQMTAETTAMTHHDGLTDKNQVSELSDKKNPKNMGESEKINNDLEGDSVASQMEIEYDTKLDNPTVSANDASNQKLTKQPENSIKPLSKTTQGLASTRPEYYEELEEIQKDNFNGDSSPSAMNNGHQKTDNNTNGHNESEERLEPIMASAGGTNLNGQDQSNNQVFEVANDFVDDYEDYEDF